MSFILTTFASFFSFSCATPRNAVALVFIYIRFYEFTFVGIVSFFIYIHTSYAYIPRHTIGAGSYSPDT